MVGWIQTSTPCPHSSGASCLATPCRTEWEVCTAGTASKFQSNSIHSACPQPAGTYFTPSGRKASTRNQVTPSIAHHRISPHLCFKDIWWTLHFLVLHLLEFSTSQLFLAPSSVNILNKTHRLVSDPQRSASGEHLTSQKPVNLVQACAPIVRCSG